jgi:hypothetical protein
MCVCSNVKDKLLNVDEIKNCDNEKLSICK